MIIADKYARASTELPDNRERTESNYRKYPHTTNIQAWLAV